MDTVDLGADRFSSWGETGRISSTDGILVCIAIQVEAARNPNRIALGEGTRGNARLLPLVALCLIVS